MPVGLLKGEGPGMEIHLMRKGHPLWEKLAAYAKECSWRAGPVLAEQMRKAAFRDWERVIAAEEDGHFIGYCTFTERDEMPEGCGYSPFIGFMFVDEKYRGQRLSETMIRRALDYAASLKFTRVYIMSGEKGLYEKYGFKKLGVFETVCGTKDQLFYIDVGEPRQGDRDGENGAAGRAWYTADPHFGVDSHVILEREMRPFKDISEYTREQVRIWNAQARPEDTVWVLGDFCNYNHLEKDYLSGLAVSGQIRARIRLITGNSEERVIAAHFGGDFERFRAYCLNTDGFRFDDVMRGAYTFICGEKFYLTHRPTDHDPRCLNLFGHTHRSTGLWKPFGFNVGVDLNHFRLFGEDDIRNLLEQKRSYWDHDPDNNS